MQCSVTIEGRQLCASLKCYAIRGTERGVAKRKAELHAMRGGGLAGSEIGRGLAGYGGAWYEHHTEDAGIWPNLPVSNPPPFSRVSRLTISRGSLGSLSLSCRSAFFRLSCSRLPSLPLAASIPTLGLPALLLHPSPPHFTLSRLTVEGSSLTFSRAEEWGHRALPRAPPLLRTACTLARAQHQRVGRGRWKRRTREEEEGGGRVQGGRMGVR